MSGPAFAGPLTFMQFGRSFYDRSSCFQFCLVPSFCFMQSCMLIISKSRQEEKQLKTSASVKIEELVKKVDFFYHNRIAQKVSIWYSK